MSSCWYFVNCAVTPGVCCVLVLQAILYCRNNEQTTNIVIVHVDEGAKPLTGEFEKSVALLGEL